MIDVERLPVHFVSQQRQLMLHVAKSVDVVITPAVSPVGVAVEYHVPSTRVGFHQFQEFYHRSSTPLGNAAPALNAVMLRDLFAETDFTQLIDCVLLGSATLPNTFTVQPCGPLCMRRSHSSCLGRVPLVQKYGDMSLSLYCELGENHSIRKVIRPTIRRPTR